MHLFKHYERIPVLKVLLTFQSQIHSARIKMVYFHPKYFFGSKYYLRVCFTTYHSEMLLNKHSFRNSGIFQEENINNKE